MKSPFSLREFKTETVIGLLAAALPAYLLRFHVGPLPMTGLEVAELAAIAVLFIGLVRKKQRKVTVSPSNRDNVALRQAQGDNVLRQKNTLLIIGSLFIFAATLAAVVIAPDKRAALGIAKAYFWEPMVLAWLLIASKPDREKAFKAALAGFAASAGVVVIYGLTQYAWPQLIPAIWTAERRITSVFDFPNAAALYLAPLAPLFFAAPLGWLLSLASLLAILLAKSAGGLGALFAAIVFLGLCFRKTRLIAVFFAGVAILALFFAPPLAGLRDQALMRDWSGRVHRIGWDESLAMLKDRPLFGAGLSGYPTAVAPYHRAQGVEIFQYPHNLFLAAWSEIGLLGIAGFALILIWFFWKFYKQRAIRHAPFVAAAMAAILAHGLVDVPYFKNDLSMMFWLFVVLMAL